MAFRRELVLLRHGIALDRGLAAAEGLADAERPLTARGRARTRAVVERLRQLDLVADRLCTSPLRRTRQTADLALAAGLAPALEPTEALAPGGDPLRLLTPWLEAAAPADRGRLLLVGHEPDLGDLAARLIGAPPGSVTLRKAGVAVLTFGPSWCLRLLLSPRSLLPEDSGQG